MRKSVSVAATAVLALLLAACGGNGQNALAGGSSSGGGGGGGGSGGSSSYTMGNGSGASFQPGMIAVSNASLSAGGSTSLQVSVVDKNGVLYTGAQLSVTFNSPCVAAGTAAIQPQATVTSSTGSVTATYAAKGCSGPDVVTATATVGSANLSATGTVTIAQSAIGSIAFVSATPTNIALKGTGDASRPESSTLVFKVLDASGGPRSGAAVSFALNTTVGGLSLTPASATANSDAQGKVQIVVNAGTVATSVKVTATVTNASPAISTQSSQLTVTTGIPTARNFSAAVSCYNIEGLTVDGTQATITARLADRFQNPVPDGTAVTFHAKSGKIGAQCVTATTPTESGVCSVTYTSQGTRPADGRVPLIATAIGEESFVDANGNGTFDAGETFYDTAEPFEDDAETGTYQLGDYYFDFNNNQLHDPPNGKFDGVLCTDTARCGSKSAGIGATNTIILSGSTPTVDMLDGSGNPVALHIPTGGGIVRLWIRDANGNPMPGGTDVTAAVSGNSGASYTLNQPTAFKVPCSAVPAGTKDGSTVYTFSVSATTAGSGTFTLTVTTPGKLATTVQIPIG